MELVLLARPATPTSAGWWVLQNAGFWDEAWPPPRPLLGWTGPEAGVPSSWDSKEGLQKTHRAEAEHRPQDPQGGQPREGNRNREKALQTGPELPLAVCSKSWCLRVYIRHSPAPAFVCWSNRLHRKTCSPSLWALRANTGQLEGSEPQQQSQAPQSPEI